MSPEGDRPRCAAYVGQRGSGRTLLTPRLWGVRFHHGIFGRPQGLDQVVFAQSLPFTLPGPQTSASGILSLWG